MSGICAVWLSDPRQVPAVLSGVTAGLRLSTEELSENHIAAALGMGVCARFGDQQIHVDDRVVIAFDADLYSTDNPWEGVQCNRGRQNAGSLLAALYERFGPRFVERLDGSYSFVLWD